MNDFFDFMNLCVLCAFVVRIFYHKGTKVHFVLVYADTLAQIKFLNTNHTNLRKKTLKIVVRAVSQNLAWFALKNKK